MPEGIENRIKNLVDILNYHNQKYYIEDSPEITDFQYDKLYEELKELEGIRPDLVMFDSPTQRVGGKPLEGFLKVEHEIQMQSLSDVFDKDDVHIFDKKVKKLVGDDTEYVVEKKIDGLSVSLEYKDGNFIRGSTRGDGFIGEDVTLNLKTIKSVPLVLKMEIPYIEVRGEVFMQKSDFLKLNESQEEAELPLFANPRNAAAGSLRQLDSKITAARKLDIFVFNVQKIEGVKLITHYESLKYLEKLGFKVCPGYKICKTSDEIITEINTIGEIRGELGFEIDGAVVKVNSIRRRILLGSTSKTPKWAIAYKYPAEQKQTVIKKIKISVGRTGVLTPNAEFDPVKIAGSTVSRATLHNMDFINEKGIKIGDTVIIQKAGDIIPEVLEVDLTKRTGTEKQFVMPEFCPECGADVRRENGESAYRCTNINCPAQLFRSIVHFASRDAMNIDGLGPAIIDILLKNNFIKGIADLYYLKEHCDELITIKGMGKISVDNLILSIENSKSNNIDRLIFGFGIRNIGLKASQILAETFRSIDNIIGASSEQFELLPEFGQIMANNVELFFKQNSIIETVNRLRIAGVNLVSHGNKLLIDERFIDKIFVLTGTLSKYSREEAGNIIKNHGGNVTGSVSGKTDFVLAGKDAGSKLEKARELGIRVISESEFEELIK
ncbi:MAG: NAD-dependent DNA ligase LigA [Clostridia bacterium]|jgi:DNA ligase (NAD+)